MMAARFLECSSALFFKSTKRLVFDSTDRGVLIFPIHAAGLSFHLAAIYQDCINPALLKRQVHALGGKLASHIQTLPRPTRVSAAPKREGYLFSDISDAEIDRLFGGV